MARVSASAQFCECQVWGYQLNVNEFLQIFPQLCFVILIIERETPD